MLWDIMVEHSMPQWIQQKTRFRSDEQPLRLDLVFTEDPGIVNGIRYKSPINKSNHILIDIELADNTIRERNEEHRGGRLIYN